MREQTEASDQTSRRFLPWLGALVGLVALAWVLREFDFGAFRAVIANADVRLIAAVLLALMAEQLVRAWKWRQLLLSLRSVSTIRLFGAIMAGYLLAVLVPFGFGTVARSWLVARRESLKLPAVLATVAMDRVTDGVVFACLVPVALASVTFADPGGIRTGLVWGSTGSLVLFALVALGLVLFRREVLTSRAILDKVLGRIPRRLAEPAERHFTAFAEGIIWPEQPWRGVAVLVSSLGIKLIAATHLLWAGLAFGVHLPAADYLFLLVFLGFLVILGHFARVAGSFLLSGVFALGLLGVAEEEALAMVLVVEASNLLSIALVGAVALWRQGAAVAELQRVTVAGLESQ